MDEPKVNLIIAAYFGPRGGNISTLRCLLEHGWLKKPQFDRQVDHLNLKNVSHSYLLSSLNKLKTVKHSLSQITIVVNECENEHPEITSYLNNLKSIGNTPVVVLRRENKGMSYGGYDHVFDTYKDKFDYYIFTEDDYAFVKDNFDTLLVDLFLEKKCGYLCGLVSTKDKFKGAFKLFGQIGCMSHGISNFESLNAVCNHFGKLPWNQVDFTASFLKVGLALEDWGEKYSSPFYHTASDNVLVNFKDGEYLIVPVQSLEKTP